MSLHSCAEAIARIQYQRPQPITEPAITPRSYRHEEWLGKRFVVLAAPMAISIARKPLPAANPNSAGWLSSIDDPSKKKRPRGRRKEESDREWKKGAPSTLVPMPRTPWFLTAEAERIEAERAERRAAQRQVPRRYADPGGRKIIRLAYDPEDTGPLPIISTKRFRDPAAFVRKQLKQLVREKRAAKNIADMADVLAAQAKGLSAREIAEQMGRTQAWVRWRLDGISEVFIRHGINSLSQRAQQKSGLAAD